MIARRIAAAVALGLLSALDLGCAYPAARWRDFTDILSMGLSIGGSIGARAAATKLVSVEIMAQKDDRFFGWRERNSQWTESSYGLLFATFRMPGIGDEVRPERRWYDAFTTSRRRTLFPVRTEIEDIRHTLFVLSGGSGIRPVDALNIDVGISVLFGGIEVSVSPGELADFLLGWFTVDIGGDDEIRFDEAPPPAPGPEKP